MLLALIGGWRRCEIVQMSFNASLAMESFVLTIEIGILILWRGRIIRDGDG
jgi:hypothetical protein